MYVLSALVGVKVTLQLLVVREMGDSVQLVELKEPCLVCEKLTKVPVILTGVDEVSLTFTVQVVTAFWLSVAGEQDTVVEVAFPVTAIVVVPELMR